MGTIVRVCNEEFNGSYDKDKRESSAGGVLSPSPNPKPLNPPPLTTYDVG